MSFKEKIQAELEKISAMDRQKKIDYFKTYYMWPTIAVLVGIALFIWFCIDIFCNKQPVSMGCAFGVILEDEQVESLTDGYMEYFGYNPKKCEAAVATDDMFAGTAQKMDAYSNTMALYAQIAAGDIYYLLLNESTMMAMENGGIYADLSQVLSDKYMQMYADNIVYLKDDETGAEYPAAIKLTAIGGFTHAGQEDSYLVFTIARPDDEYPDRLIEYLMSCK